MLNKKMWKIFENTGNIQSYLYLNECKNNNKYQNEEKFLLETIEEPKIQLL